MTSIQTRALKCGSVSMMQGGATEEDDDFRVPRVSCDYKIAARGGRGVAFGSLPRPQEESPTPARTLQLSVAGVTGRTIRNRIRKAKAKLLRLKEDA